MGDPNFKPNQITAQQVQDRILQGFGEGTEVHVKDVNGDGYHFEVAVTSADFSGLNRVKQHQKVYELLGDEFKNQLHAMTLKTSEK